MDSITSMQKFKLLPLNSFPQNKDIEIDNDEQIDKVKYIKKIQNYINKLQKNSNFPKLPNLKKHYIKSIKSSQNILQRKTKNTWTCYAQSKKGYIPNHQKINQDSFIIDKIKSKFGITNILAVFDGHGLKGHLVSRFVSKHLLSQIKTLLQQDTKQLKYRITKIFEKTQQMLKQQHFDTNTSGTTCLIILIQKERVIEINLGDSSVMFLSNQRKKMKMIYENKKHNFENVCEMSRFENNCRIESLKDQDGKEFGVKRVWMIDQNIPGLAVSRTLGDTLAHSLGVSPIPGNLIRSQFS